MRADFQTRYDLAREAAAAAGAFALNIYERDFTVDWKQDQSPVTEADRGAERLIREAIERHFPSDAVLGEEAGEKAGQSGFRWIIDPIDGTRSFVRRIPHWATLIGIEYHGELIAGVAAAPALGTTYHALRGHGAYQDQRRISVSAIGDLSKSMLCYSSIRTFRKQQKLEQFLDLVACTERQRGYGDFYGFVLVAQGSCEMMLDGGVHPWDVAAVLPIIQEAGGCLTDWSGQITIHASNVLASNGLVHAEVLEKLGAPKVSELR